MGLFSGIFDGLSDTVNDLFGASTTGSGIGDFAGSVLSAGGKALSAQGGGGSNSAGTAVSNSEFRAQRELSQLNFGTIPINGRVQTEVPTHYKNQFQGPESVSPTQLEDEWDRRLSVYARIVRETGVGVPGK